MPKRKSEPKSDPKNDPVASAPATVPASFAPFLSLLQVVYATDSKRFVVVAYPNKMPAGGDADDEEDPLFELLPAISTVKVEEESEEEECVVFEVGEIGDGRRWWTGKWTMKEVKEVATATGGTEALKTIIASTAKNFREGMLSIGGTAQGLHDSQTQTQTDSLQSFANDPFLRIDSPVAGGIRRIRLVGLPKEQAWRRAGEMLFAIATHVSSAQEGRLFVKPEKEKGGEQQEELEKAKQEVAFLNNELKKHDEPAIAPPPKPTPGRSLANPSKKARKVKEVEFADSDDEGEPKRVKKRR